jgi:hypothetical protein
MVQQLQQHINRGSKRVARMTGRSEPAEHELRAEMHKRMYLLGSGPELRVRSSSPSIAEGSNFSKRYFLHSHQAAKNTSRTNTTNTPSTTNTTTSGTSTGPGVSTLDIQAATNGGLTPANKPTANNTLGLDIE